MTGERLPIILDIQATLSPDNAGRGIGRYVIDLTQALLEQTDRVVLLGLNPLLPPPKHLPWDLYKTGRVGFVTQETVNRVAPNGAWYCILSPVELTPPASAVLPAWLRDPKYKLATVAYDLIPMLYPDIFLRDEVLRERYMTRMMMFQVSDVVLAISQSTANDLTTHLDIPASRVTNIFTGVSPGFFEREHDASALIKRNVPQITKPFVFTVSGFTPHKNLKNLLDGFAALPQSVRDDFQLVVSCSLLESERAEWEKQRDARGLRAHDVIFTGWISDATLRALYQTARLFVFPSLYEGFGLPAAEAIASGTPAIASSASSLPEIVGEVSATFDPLDPTSIADRLKEFLTDSVALDQLRARQQERLSLFSWSGVANRFLAALESHEQKNPLASSSVVSKPRVLMATPMPPSKSGIATYNAQLLPELVKYLDVEVAVKTSEELDYCEAADIPAVLLSDIGTHINPYSYDDCIWVIGNSDFHVEIRRLAESFPGTVWMHDTCLAFLDVWLAFQEPDFYEAISDSLEKAYGARFSPTALARLDQTNPYEFAQRGMAFTGPLFRHARRLITSSRFAYDLVKLDQGPDAHLPPAHVLPLAFPNYDEFVVDPRPISEYLVVGTIGIGAQVKMADVIIRAAAIANVNVEVRCIGYYSDDYQKELLELAQASEVALSVRTASDHNDYLREIAQIDVAVQLRSSSNGESSAALNDAVALGKPVITNMPTFELKSDAVTLISQTPSDAEVAEQLEALATKHDRQAIFRAARELSRSWTFENLARELSQLLGGAR